MRAFNKLPLDDDIIDRIFTFLPSFATFQSFLLTSKAIYEIYNRYPNSIVRAVAYNVAGPALPQALRLVRFRFKLQEGIDSDEDEDESDTSGILPEESSHITTINQSEAKEVTAVASVATELEVLFSRMRKDRRSSTSKLTPIESWRFCCALYRIMLFSKRFEPKLSNVVEATADDDEGAEAIRKFMKTCRTFLDAFLDTELLQIRAVMLFLKGLAWSAAAAHGSFGYSPEFGELALISGPEAILSCVQEWSTDPVYSNTNYHTQEIPSEVVEGFLDQPLGELLDKRNVKLPADYAAYHKVIIDHVEGEDDKCEQCQQVHGMALWNENNWDLLRCALGDNDIVKLLKGRLSYSPDGIYLVDLLRDRPQVLPTALQEMFDEHRIFKYAPLEKHHWLCLNCLKEFMRDHLHIWLCEHKRKAGLAIHDNCWYGYNCRTQMHKSAHAAKLNHLCEPTRGDP